MTRSNVKSINQDCFVVAWVEGKFPTGNNGACFSLPGIGTGFSTFYPRSRKKKGYLREQCREIGEQPDNKLQNVTSYKTLKRAVNSSVTLHPVLYYLDTFI